MEDWTACKLDTVALLQGWSSGLRLQASLPPSLSPGWTEDLHLLRLSVWVAVCSLLTVKLFQLALAYFFPSRIISSNLSSLYWLSPKKANTLVSGDRALRIGAGEREDSAGTR